MAGARAVEGRAALAHTGPLRDKRSERADSSESVDLVQLRAARDTVGTGRTAERPAEDKEVVAGSRAVAGGIPAWLEEREAKVAREGIWRDMIATEKSV